MRPAHAVQEARALPATSAPTSSFAASRFSCAFSAPPFSRLPKNSATRGGWLKGRGRQTRRAQPPGLRAALRCASAPAACGRRIREACIVAGWVG